MSQIYQLEDFLDYILVTGRGFMSDWAISLDEKDIRIFHDSVIRAQANGIFLDTFYDAFMDSTKGYHHYYSHADMQRIKGKLHESLKMIAQLEDQQADDCVVINDMPRINARFHVSEGMYQLWLEALLKTVSRCDPHFNNYLENIWRHIVSDGIAHMIERTAAHDDNYQVVAV